MISSGKARARLSAPAVLPLAVGPSSSSAGGRLGRGEVSVTVSREFAAARAIIRCLAPVWVKRACQRSSPRPRNMPFAI